MYSSDINSINIGTYEDTFITLSEYIYKMLNDEDVKVEAKFITRSYTVMNLYWMMMNGLDTYEDAVTAMVEYEKSLKVKSTEWPYMNEKGNNLVWACNGLGTSNNKMKMKVLSDILETVLHQEPESV